MFVINEMKKFNLTINFMMTTLGLDRISVTCIINELIRISLKSKRIFWRIFIKFPTKEFVSIEILKNVTF